MLGTGTNARQVAAIALPKVYELDHSLKSVRLVDDNTLHTRVRGCTEDGRGAPTFSASAA
jgi:hypothetical protein